MKIEPELTEKFLSKSDKLCRICLTECGESSFSLFELHGSAKYSERVMLCSRIQVKEDDGLPSIICQLCSTELDTADRFRLKCETSDSILREFYQVTANAHESTAIASENDICKDEVDQLLLLMPKKEDEDSDMFSDRDEFVAEEQPKKLKKSKRKKVQPYRHENSDEFDEEMNRPLKSKAAKRSEERCLICSRMIPNKKMLAKHMKTTHNGESPIKKFQCPDCPYSTPRRQTLLYHSRRHTGEKPYQCPECPRCFSQPSSLSTHLKSHSDKTYFTCAQCGKQFKHKEKFKRHKSVHSDEKNFVCEICNKGLKSRETLRSHMDRHYNIRNFSCETCGSSFVTRIELINHSKKHSSEKKYECTICDFRTRLKQILEKHVKRHTGERSFKCEHCAYTCYERSELKFHMRKHTREKKYSCPVCQKLFIHSSSVNKHMLRIHGMFYRVNDSVDRRKVK